MNPKISMKDLYEKMGKLGPNEIILDVRGIEEFRAGHIPGSKNIPHDQVGSHIEELTRYAKIYIHCQAGRRAQMAVGVLQKAGLSNLVCVASGGMGDWIASGLPVEKS